MLFLTLKNVIILSYTLFRISNPSIIQKVNILFFFPKLQAFYSADISHFFICNYRALEI